MVKSVTRHDSYFTCLIELFTFALDFFLFTGPWNFTWQGPLEVRGLGTVRVLPDPEHLGFTGKETMRTCLGRYIGLLCEQERGFTRARTSRFYQDENFEVLPGQELRSFSGANNSRIYQSKNMRVLPGARTSGI